MTTSCLTPVAHPEVIRDAATAAPTPLTIFTTITPAAQLFSVAQNRGAGDLDHNGGDFPGLASPETPTRVNEASLPGGIPSG